MPARSPPAIEECSHANDSPRSVAEEPQTRRVRRLHEHDDRPARSSPTQESYASSAVANEHRLPVPRALEIGGEVHAAGAARPTTTSLRDAEPHGEQADAVVLLVGVLAELAHLAEHGDRALRRAPTICASVLQRGGHRVGARVVGVVDDGDAVAAPEHLHAPALGERRRSRARRRRRSSGTPSSRRRRDRREGVHHVVLAEDARAARGADSPVGQRHGEVRCRPRCATMSSARTSAPARRARTSTTRAGGRWPAIAATRGSSALSTATAVAGRSATISDLARWTSPRCRRTRRRGRGPPSARRRRRARRSRTSRAISPTRARAHLDDEELACPRRRASIEIGAPTSLLNEARGATVGALALEDRRAAGSWSSSCRWSR